MRKVLRNNETDYESYRMEGGESVYLQSGDRICLGEKIYVLNKKGDRERAHYHTLTVMTDEIDLNNGGDAQDWEVDVDTKKSLMRVLGEEYYSLDERNVVYKYQLKKCTFEVQFKGNEIPPRREKNIAAESAVVLPFKKGGFSAIYKMTGRDLKEYAFKCPMNGSSDDTEKEMRVLAKLAGVPFVVFPIKFVNFRQKSTIMIVMPFAKYGDLQEQLKLREKGFGIFSESSSEFDLSSLYLDIILQVAIALEYAHEKKIAHCDLKPANIFIGDWNKESNTCNICIGDFNSSENYGDDGYSKASGSTPGWRY